MITKPNRLVAASAVLLAVSTAACSAGLDSVPLPSPSVGPHSYTLTVTFANALNLPAQAKVKVDGADVGEVESMRAHDYAAIVTLRIRAGTVLPAGTTAELRSATPLGDVFVALTRPANPAPGAAPLHDDSSIPQTSTSAAATIEEVLARAAMLVNGGAIRNLTKTVNGLGAELGGNGDHLADLIAQTTALVNTLSSRSGQIQGAVHDADALTATVAARQSTVNDAVAAAGPALDVLSSNTGTFVDLADRLGRIARQLQRYPSVNGTGQRSLIADMNNLAAGMNAAAIDPNSNLDELNRTISVVGGKVTSATAAAADAEIAQIAVGAVPDPNFPGSSAAKIPDQTDWANFVGSLAYTLGRLHDRVVGPGR